MSGTITSRVLIFCINRDVDLMRDVYKSSQAKKGIVVLGKEKMYSPIGFISEPKLEDTFECLKEEKMADDLDGIQADIYDFEEIMQLLFCLIKKIKAEGNEVYISIVGGSGEFCSAASIISMIVGGVTILGAKITDEKIEAIKEDGTKEYFNHKKTSSITINQINLTGPDDILLDTLSIFNSVPVQKRTSTRVITDLIEDGVWYRIRDIGTPTYKYEFTSLDPNIKAGKDSRGNDKDAEGMRRDLKANEKNVYQRRLIAEWEDLKWIEKNDRTAAKYSLTDKGKSMLRIYRTPIDFENILRPIKELNVEFEQIEYDTPVNLIELK